MDVLLLCTANQCRSPMAEALLRHRLEAAGVPARVSSAGLHPGGRPATAHGVEMMAARGLDTSSHVSRRLARDLVDDADLVLGMAREHVREVAVMDGAALDRTFTLKELVRLGEESGARRPGETMAAWLVRVAARRRRNDLLGIGHDPSNDIDDPVGKGRADYERTADEIDGLLARLVDLAWPAAVIDSERQEVTR